MVPDFLLGVPADEQVCSPPAVVTRPVRIKKRRRDSARTPVRASMDIGSSVTCYFAPSYYAPLPCFRVRQKLAPSKDRGHSVGQAEQWAVVSSQPSRPTSRPSRYTARTCVRLASSPARFPSISSRSAVRSGWIEPSWPSSPSVSAGTHVARQITSSAASARSRPVSANLCGKLLSQARPEVVARKEHADARATQVGQQVPAISRRARTVPILGPAVAGDE